MKTNHHLFHIFFSTTQRNTLGKFVQCFVVEKPNLKNMPFTDSVLKVHLYMYNIDDCACKFKHCGFKSNILIVLQKGTANHCIPHH